VLLTVTFGIKGFSTVAEIPVSIALPFGLSQMRSAYLTSVAVYVA